MAAEPLKNLAKIDDRALSVPYPTHNKRFVRVEWYTVFMIVFEIFLTLFEMAFIRVNRSRHPRKSETSWGRSGRRP